MDEKQALNYSMDAGQAFYNQAGLNDNLSEENSSKNMNFRSSSLRRKEKNLAEAKKARNQIEKDAQLLANRIALLKQEEMKTWKKIEETRKRAKDVMVLKHKNEERVQRQMEIMKANEDVVKQNQNNVYQLRKEREREKKKIQESIFLSKKDEALQLKMVKANNESKKRDYIDKISQENAIKNQIIREQLRQGSHKITYQKKQKLEEFKKHYSKRLDEEDRHKQDKEAEVMQMEMIEMELIKKLKNTQAIQKSAYSELEQALSQPSFYFGNIAKKNIMTNQKMPMSSEVSPHANHNMEGEADRRLTAGSLNSRGK